MAHVSDTAFKMVLNGSISVTNSGSFKMDISCPLFFEYDPHVDRMR